MPNPSLKPFPSRWTCRCANETSRTQARESRGRDGLLTMSDPSSNPVPRLTMVRIGHHAPSQASYQQRQLCPPRPHFFTKKAWSSRRSPHPCMGPGNRTPTPDPMKKLLWWTFAPMNPP
ncbi:hypothetical protein TCAL_16341 [Tigriopus californicus]|uniref:Uncharacterized protein n=1 Tax=Tigriopus californicus TaxID=6832 RepID=A0A553N6J5_TIGCA|nr:hypothetical protein TCAL_16341 [Tigriopus californicus]